VHARAGDRPRRRDVLGDLDADARTAVARLDDVRAGERRLVVGLERHARQRRDPGRRDHPAERELVHAERGRVEAAAGRRHAQQGHEARVAAALAEAAVQARQGRVDLQAL